MEKILNWGLLSTARINHALIGPIQSLKRHRLLAVASRTRVAAEAYARDKGIPRAHGSYEALLSDPEIDVIYNPLPNHLHAEWTIKALKAGKHVLCEKPLALTLKEVDAMSAASRNSGRVLAEAFMYRHHPQTLRARELVDAGVLGKILLIKGEFSFKLDRKEDYRNFKNMGGGSIWDIGCYPISFARTIAGEKPDEVFGWQVLGPGKCDLIFAGQMKFPNGILCQFDSGFASPIRTSMEIIGTEGTLVVPVPFKPGGRNEIFIRRGDKQQREWVRGTDLYAGEVEDMYEAVVNGRVPRISLADSRDNIEVILALLESAEGGRPVKLTKKRS